jgi:hypothetical protein
VYKRQPVMAVWLCIVMVVNAINVFRFGFRSVQNLASFVGTGSNALATFLQPMMVVVCALAFIGAALLYRGRKVGFHVFLTACALSFVFQVVATQNFIGALISSAIPVFLMYGALNIGGERKAWPQLH